MAVNRDYTLGHEELELSCDECGSLTGRSYLTDEFPRMIRAAKEAGWHVRQGRDGWLHTCPDCLSDEPSNLERQRAKFAKLKTYTPDIEELL